MAQTAILGFMAAGQKDTINLSVYKFMVKYEPNFFVFPREKRRFPEDKIRNTPVTCKSEPLSIAFLAMSFIKEQLTQQEKDVLVLEENKSKILPGKLQEKVKILSLRSETLFLKTNSSVWRAELMAVKTNIISSCNKILGKIAVKAIRVV